MIYLYNYFIVQSFNYFIIIYYFVIINYFKANLGTTSNSSSEEFLNYTALSKIAVKRKAEKFKSSPKISVRNKAKCCSAQKQRNAITPHIKTIKHKCKELSGNIARRFVKTRG